MELIALAVVEANKLLQQREQEIKQLTAENKAMKPKANYYDLIVNSPNLIPITVIAKDYGKSAQWLNKYLVQHKIQYKCSGVYVLTKDYADKGYTGTKTYTYSTNNEPISYMATHWTQAGRKFIYELLKHDNILPIMEREVA